MYWYIKLLLVRLLSCQLIVDSNYELRYVAITVRCLFGIVIFVLITVVGTIAVIRYVVFGGLTDCLVCRESCVTR